MSYESARPIEAGCLAVITAAKSYPEWVGKIVTVIEFKGTDRYGRARDYWKVDIPAETCRCYVDECSLLRIDDDSIQTELEREQELEHA